MKYDLPSLRAQPDGDDQLVINMDKVPPIILKGDMKFKLVKNNTVIKINRPKTIAVFWDVVWKFTFIRGKTFCLVQVKYKKDHFYLVYIDWLSYFYTLK